MVAAEIQCCNGGPGGYAECGQKLSSCQWGSNLEAVCQSPITTLQVFKDCGQFFETDPIIRGSQQEDLAACLNNAFGLGAQFIYA